MAIARPGGSRNAALTWATALALVYQPRRTSNCKWSPIAVSRISAIVTPNDQECCQSGSTLRSWPSSTTAAVPTDAMYSLSRGRIAAQGLRVGYPQTKPRPQNCLDEGLGLAYKTKA